MHVERLAQCRATLPVVGREERLLCSATCSTCPCSPDDEDGDDGDGALVVDDDDHLDLLAVIHQLVHLSCCPWIYHTKS